MVQRVQIHMVVIRVYVLMDGLGQIAASTSTTAIQQRASMARLASIALVVSIVIVPLERLVSYIKIKSTDIYIYYTLYIIYK